MALFQPSNITPSTFAGLQSGVISQSDEVNITWQVNGNSAMQAFKIDFFQNDAASTQVGSTGIITENCPFFGKDNKGNSVMFTYAPNRQTWNGFNIADGNTYKMKITQYWGTLSGGNYQYSVEQLSPSVFLSRTKPIITIDSVPFTINTVKKTFTATYSQQQGEAINWCRWQLSTSDSYIYPSSTDVTILSDTGEVNTPILSFTVDGLLPNTRYAVRCTVESQSGIIGSSGWETFKVEYDENIKEDFISTTVMNDSSIFIEIDPTSIPQITGDPTPTENYGQLVGNKFELYENSNVKWKDKDGITVTMNPPYSVGWSGDVTGMQLISATQSSQGNVYSAEVSPNREYLLVSKSNQAGQAVLEIYQIRSSLQLIESMIMQNLSAGFGISFSPDGKYVMLAGSLYGFNNGILTHVQDVTSNTVTSTAFSSSDYNLLVVCMGENGAQLYSYDPTSETDILTLVTEIQNNGSAMLANHAAFVNNVVVIGTDESQTSSDGFAVLFQITEENGSYTVTKLLSLSDSDEAYPSVVELKALSDHFFVKLSYDVYDYEYVKNARIYDLSGNYTSCPDYVYDEDVDTVTAITSTIFVGTIAYSTFVEYAAGGVEQDFQGFCSWDASGDSNVSSYYFKKSSIGFPLAVVGNSIVTNTIENQPTLRLFKRNDKNFLSFVFQDSSRFTLKRTSTELLCGTTSVSLQGHSATISCNEGTIEIEFLNDSRLDSMIVDISDSILTQPVQSIEIYGWQICSYLGIVNGTVSFRNYTDMENTNLILSNQFFDSFLYRNESGALKKILELNDSLLQFKDFGAKSLTTYSYEFIQTLQDVSGNILISNDLCVRYTSYYLLETTPDANNPDLYHVSNVWRFGNNISAGSVSNNNSPGWLTNFTPYRLRQPTSQMGKSGTLQALLGNAKNGKYQDTSEQMESLYALSQSTNPLFLKDMKGNIYMVQISAPITQTINTASGKQEVTVSVPWEEVGDASNVSLIQLPTDEGWKSNMILDVSVDVDPMTGMLTVTYPDDYVGTTFRMQNGVLYAMTDGEFASPSFSINGGILSATMEE